MPEVSRFYGIIIKMFYNDHNPPHFHAEYGEFKVVVSIEKGIVKGEMPGTALKLILEWLMQHKKELLNNWENIEQKKPVKHIEPLT
jgi:hypothetical protein